MRVHGQFFSEFAIAENFDSSSPAISEARLEQHIGIHSRTLVELVQRLQVNGKITGRVAGVVKTALWDAANERHLTAFEADANRTAGAGGLAFTAAAAGLAMAAGFALAKALAAMLGTGTRFKIV